ncbi:MAG TPA: DUF1697 domain-containing protein [Bryobacteraceae bacterium]|jgi:uncharacterized protein (DUF1697 family)
MTVISMLRAVNLAKHNRISMDALRGIYEDLGFRDVRTYVQSGNVVFQTSAKDLARMAKRIEDAIEAKFKFRPAVILRTPEEMKAVVARNPFAGRKGIEPARLAVFFLACTPDGATRQKLESLETAPEELRVGERELFIYYPNGMARPKLPIAKLERILSMPSTARNWNTVTNLIELATELRS